MLTRRLFATSVGDEVDLEKKAIAQLEMLDGKLPNTQILRNLSREVDTNLASAVLYQSILRDKIHGQFIQQVNSAPCKVFQAPTKPLLIIVPGMFYREYPEIGADGKLIANIAAKFDIQTHTVPTSSLGSVSENLELLHEYLKNIKPRPFWLVSMSRGSAEVKWLLQSYSDASYMQDLRGWISICGIHFGTPLHEQIYSNRFYTVLHRRLAWVNGINPSLGEELVTSNSRWKPTQCLSNMQFINLIAVPLSWHITHRAIARYNRISHLGPTDGVVLLGDYLNEPGLIYPIWGADHFLRTAQISALFYRLLNFLFTKAKVN